MKVCERCGIEIYTRDAENECLECEDAQDTKRRGIKAHASRLAREDALASCGLVKVRGALGGTYWE